ncbi:major facilitator superfamily domain-containing protein [Boeremia exigua]|uniref:major facilitator superfamily domain-containing protein n=1 Tax=Boeremia exigua TaxID=749465 RepID=UPI001E8EDB1E|nr:major facilitator superfamily domain-containing protein [Boeremia exigua]KAH6620041.1 major facilitator superfamily domain-containing protein [Boeremia exigua]
MTDSTSSSPRLLRALRPTFQDSHPTRNKQSIRPLVVLLILVHLSAVLYTLPLNRVIELRLCQDHYERHDRALIPTHGPIPEKLCKIDEVQQRLAWLQGIMETTLVVCDFLVTIPFSFIAERYGVRTVLWCNLVPRIFMSVWTLTIGYLPNILPTKAIIVGPFLAIFGGECVLQSTIFALTSALANEYVQRASYFSYISSTSYVVSFLGPTLASTTMSWNIWLPFWINIGLLTCAIPTIMLLPQTAKPTVVDSSAALSEPSDIEEAGPLLADDEGRASHYANAFEKPHGFVQECIHAARKLLDLIKGRRNFQVLLCSFFLTALASSDTKLLVQYISKRYEWTFAQAGFMLSAKAIVNFTLLAIIVPRLIRKSMSSRAVHGSEVRLNYLGAEISILISIVGVLCVALAFQFWMLLAALMIYALGSALPVFTMSLVKSQLIAIGDSDTQDFSIVMLTKTLGSLVGAPLMASLWIQAIKLGGLGLGLPYLVSATIYATAANVVANLHF